jgi:tRNA pseudouridine38-40 synthase
MERSLDALKYVLKICYDGSRFHGYQRQPAQITVQGYLEKALRKLLGEEVNLAAAGRTDTGVHGLGQVVAFEAAKSVPARAVLEGVNGRLGDSVAILQSAVLPPESDFHPRYSAQSRTYHYYILSEAGPAERVFWSKRAWCLGEAPDPELMQAAAEVFRGEHDFKTFTARCDMPHYRRNVLDITITPEAASEKLLVVKLRANAFLRRMVRRLVAGLVETGLGLTTVEELKSKLEARNPGHARHTAPGGGLYFHSVEYSPDPFSEIPALDYYVAKKRPGLLQSG